MKKILIPFTLSVLLVFVACASNDNNKNNNKANSSLSDGTLLPKFDVNALTSQLKATNFTAGWPDATDATTLRISRKNLIKQSYGLDRLNLILENKDSKTLNVLLPSAVKSTLDSIASLEQHYAGMSMVGDGLRRDVTENGKVVRIYQYLAGKNGIFDTDATYSSLVEFDPAG